MAVLHAAERFAAAFPRASNSRKRMNSRGAKLRSWTRTSQQTWKKSSVIAGPGAYQCQARESLGDRFEGQVAEVFELPQVVPRGLRYGAE